MPSPIRQAGELLRRSAYTVALTGAGISTPSGIPDFRSPQSGLWSRSDPLEVASLWAFHERPEDFYAWIRPLFRTVITAQPNTAHRVLAEMEARRCLSAIITQNIDSLHQRAGNQRVLELHGHIRTASCLACRAVFSSESLWPQLLAGAPPRCPDCGAVLKPDVILFGEPLPYEVLSAAQHEALACEVMLVIGTSLEVMPAADLPQLAHRRGARLIMINRTPTALDDQADFIIHDDVSRALLAVWQAWQNGAR
jgi:NAD-dependent deacetylase